MFNPHTLYAYHITTKRRSRERASAVRHTTFSNIPRTQRHEIPQSVVHYDQDEKEGLNPFLVSAPSTGPSLPAQSSSASSPSYGLIVITGISFLCFNGIISVFLIWARQLRRSKKAAVGTSLELPAGTYPSELKEDGVHEMYDAPPELQEDALHEMPVQPPEMMGDMWPELAGGPAQVSVSGNSSGQGCLDIEDQEIENDETRPVSKKSIHGQ